MTALVIGASGFIGAEVTAGLRLHTDVVGTFRNNPAAPPSVQLALEDRELREASRYDLVVICVSAAHELTSADELGRWRDDVSRVIEAVADARVVLLSTDAVLGDGGPHPPTTEPAPGTLYGEASLVAEQVVGAHGDSAVVRTSYVFGVGARGPDPRVLDLLRMAQDGEQMRAAADAHRSPTELGDLAAELVRISLDTDAQGIFHVAGPRMSLYEHFSRVADALELPARSVEQSSAAAIGIEELDTSLLTEGDPAVEAERYERWLRALAGGRAALMEAT